MTDSKAEFIWLNEGDDNGYVMIRRNLYAHFHDGDIKKCELDIMLALLMMANKHTGITKTSASRLSKFYFGEWDEEQVRYALRKLEKIFWIHREIVRGKNKVYEITINKFKVMTDDPQKHVRVEFQIDANHEKGPKFQGTIYVTCAKTGSKLENRQVIETAPTPVLTTTSGGSSKSVSGESQGSVTQKEIQEPYFQPIQDGDGNGRRKTTTTTVSVSGQSSLSATQELPEQPAGEQIDSEEQVNSPVCIGEAPIPPVAAAPLPPRTSGTPKTPSPAVAQVVTFGGPTSTPASRLSVARATPAPDAHFDALAWAFTNEDDFEDRTCEEVRDVIWWHWKTSPNTYWQSPKANVASLKRLAKVFSIMEQQFWDQAPEGYEYPDCAYDREMVPDAACPLCKGKGGTEVDDPNPKYKVPFDLHKKVWEFCDCRTPGRYYWQTRKKTTEEDAA